MRNWNLRAWVAATVGVLLMASFVVATAVRKSDEGAAYALGAVIADIVMPLALAAAVRWAYVRWAAPGRRVTDWPWLLLTAGVIAFILLGATAEREKDRAVEEAHDCGATVGDPYAPLGRGLRYRPLDARSRELLQEALPADFRELYDARLVHEGDTVVGFVLTAAIRAGEDPREGFEAGFVERIQEQGATVRQDRVRGTPVTTAVLDGQSMVVNSIPCYGIAVISADMPSAKLIAAPLLERD